MADDPRSTEVARAQVEFHRRPFLRPLQLSSGTITGITEARVQVPVRVAGHEVVGRGSTYLSPMWAWPSSIVGLEQRDAALRAYCLRIADLLPQIVGTAAHPLELGLRLHEWAHDGAGSGVGEALARVMCASPFDAALHDGAGIALGRSSFDFFREPYSVPHADRYFDGTGEACRAITRLLRPAKRTLDAWWIVSSSDSLDELGSPTAAHGYHAFKVKILGRDSTDDARRTSAVYRAARSFGVRYARLCVDSNEANPDSASVLDFLERLESCDAEAYGSLEYLEQPTHRDILGNPHDWRAVTRRKPVLLDEGFSSMEVLPAAVAQGWSGLALKTCKGHSLALTAAAWAHSRGLAVALQDLTNPGLSAIHAALFASRVPTINGVELNSPQYTPAANAEWLPRLRSLFEPTEGAHGLPDASPAGLGSRL